jgi:hypothetical protein
MTTLKLVVLPVHQAVSLASPPPLSFDVQEQLLSSSSFLPADGPPPPAQPLTLFLDQLERLQDTSAGGAGQNLGDGLPTCIESNRTSATDIHGLIGGEGRERGPKQNLGDGLVAGSDLEARSVVASPAVDQQ